MHTHRLGSLAERAHGGQPQDASSVEEDEWRERRRLVAEQRKRRRAVGAVPVFLLLAFASVLGVVVVPHLAFKVTFGVVGALVLAIIVAAPRGLIDGSNAGA